MPVMDELDRIDSWKQIAAYLGRSERTVRRWQQVEGLPVHRHVHQQRGSVWAYKKELDEWLSSRKERPEPLADAPDPPAQVRSTRVIVGVAFALGAVAAAAVFWPSRPSAPPRILEPETLAALPGSAYSPAFSPDRSRVAFFWTPGSPAPGIYVKAIGSEAVNPLALGKLQGDFVYAPEWSPDGKTVAYLLRTFPSSRFAPYAPTSETWLCLVDAAGGPERRLIRLAKDVLFYANRAYLSWSFDGRWILAPIADGERRGIHWIPVGSGEPVQLTKPWAGHHFAPALAPDGRSFVFMRQTGPGQAAIEELFRQDLAADGSPQGAPRLLYKGRWMSSGLAWTPSGKELIFCKADSALLGPFNSRLYRMSAEVPGEMSPLGLGHCITPAMSRPDHSGAAMLAYGSGESTKSRLWHASLGAMDGGKPFAPSSRFEGMPTYSPDGSLVAFVSNRSGALEVWVAHRDGAGAKRLTENSNVSSSPQWSPDGNRLVYGASMPPTGGGGRMAAHRLYIVPLAGGAPAPLPLGLQPAADPAWSADGEHLRYWSDQQLWRVGLDGSGAVKLGEYPADFIRPWSLAGQNDRSVIYVRAGKPFTLCRNEIETGKEQVIAEDLQTPFFAATRKFAYFVKGADGLLYAAPLAGGASRRLGQLPGFDARQRLIMGMSVSPDDERIIWAISDEQRSDLLLVRNFR